MKKKTVLRLGCAALSLIMLVGCGGKKKEESSLADKLNELSSKAEQEAGSNEGSNEAEDTSDVKVEGSPAAPPEYFLSEVYENDGAHRYEQIYALCEGDSYSDLKAQLQKVNEQVAAEEKASSEDKVEWNTYVRRADDKVLSIACEYRLFGDEHDYVRMRGHSYLIGSGKELELSDIVDDMDAFYDLLADKVTGAVRENMKMYDPDLDVGKIDARGGMEDCIDKGNYGWVLDPQGLSFWFENINAAMGFTSAGVLFSDDKAGNIFNKEFSQDVPAEWVMQIPGFYSTTYFDFEDDGSLNAIEWSANYGFDSEGNDLISGIHAFYDGRFFHADDICPADGTEWTGYKGMLIHKDKQTVLLTFHYAETDAVWTSFTLKNYLVEQADTKVAFPEWANDSGFNGKYIPTDVSGIKVYLDTGGDETVPRNTELLSVDMDGKITVTGEENTAGSGNSAEGSKKLDYDPEEFDPDFLASNFGGKVCVYECEDYDGDGTKEAFVVMGQDDDEGGYLPETLWFIAKDGTATEMMNDFKGMSLYYSENGYFIRYD
ncbi:MAG: hypothetical protein K6E63_05505, partial [Lachnospiraceae bacterium]|nr:hypothetical protein [Lachnospiraceae bacterium]